MRSILVAGAARILHLSRIHHGNGTQTHYRGLRDDRMRRHRGRRSTYAPLAPRSPRRGRRHTHSVGWVRPLGPHGPKPLVKGACGTRTPANRARRTREPPRTSQAPLPVLADATPGPRTSPTPLPAPTRLADSAPGPRT